tara:strand:+ start:606 stop:1433 length:828 start_codon:yes stop_codon:yes gene_type:complete
MGLLSFLGFSSDDEYDDVDEASVQRLESLSEQAVEAVMVPEESIPIEEDAWTLAPSPARARVGASGFEPAIVEGKPTPSDSSTIDTKAIEQRLDDRFDRIEATMGIMDARLTQLNVSDNLPHVLPTDTLVTVDGGGGGEVEQEGTTSEDVEYSESPEGETVNLLDLYEGSVADLNPFLNRRSDSRSQGPSVTVSEISALLLDHLSAESANLFIDKAKTSGMISKDESTELTAIIGLANPAINNDGSEHLPHRTLLMFGSMVEAWRNSRATSEEGA